MRVLVDGWGDAALFDRRWPPSAGHCIMCPGYVMPVSMTVWCGRCGEIYCCMKPGLCVSNPDARVLGMVLTYAGVADGLCGKGWVLNERLSVSSHMKQSQDVCQGQGCAPGSWSGWTSGPRRRP